MKKIILALTIIIFLGLSTQTQAASLLEGFVENWDSTSGCFKSATKCLEIFKKTGCRGDSADYQYKCAQLFYQEQQNKLIISQQASQTTLEEKEQAIKELELNNQKLQELFKEQNQRIDSLTVSLKNANLLNIGLSIISGIFLIGLIFIFIKKKKWQSQNKNELNYEK